MAYAFISYSHEDEKIAVEIEETLTSYELNPWRDRKNMLGGETWHIEIDEAINAAYAVVVICTEESMKSSNVTYEWARAMGMGIKIVPVTFEAKKGCVLDQLKSVNWLFYDRGDFLQSLIDTLTKHRNEHTFHNISIPVEADRELKVLATQAFNALSSYEQTQLALTRLADMPEDDMARTILIVGLDSRQKATQLDILKLMEKTQFDDERAIPPLIEIVLTEEEKRNKPAVDLVCRAAERVLSQMNGVAAEKLTGEWRRLEQVGDVQSSQRILIIMCQIGDGSGLQVLGEWLGNQSYDGSFKLDLLLAIQSVLHDWEQTHRYNNTEWEQDFKRFTRICRTLHIENYIVPMIDTRMDEFIVNEKFHELIRTILNINSEESNRVWEKFEAKLRSR